MTQFVFISHSNMDKPQLTRLIERLITAGIRIWLDNPARLGYSDEQVARDFFRLHAGGPYEAEIKEAHAKAGLVIAVWSRNVVAAFAPGAEDSGRILREEIIEAKAQNKLICCQIDDVLPNTYPPPFNREQVANICRGGSEFEVELGKLVRDIQQKLCGAAFRTYWSDRKEEWSKDRYGAGGKLFTDLALLLDLGADAEERWQQKKENYKSLDAVLQANTDHRAVVLLGSPGSGKSTLLRHRDLEIAGEGLKQKFTDWRRVKFSYFVSLRDYRGEPGALPPQPLKWLRERWEMEWRSKFSQLPTLDQLLSETDLLLLLDALNEMPHGDAKEYEQLVDQWSAFIADLVSRRWPCRIVFSCRSLVYSDRLLTTVNMVPHIDILPLDEATIRSFLAHYAPKNATTLFERIREPQQIELYSTAYFLKMLVAVASDTGEIPGDRAALMTAYVRKLLSREHHNKTALLVNAGPLARDDVARLQVLAHKDEGWHSPYELLEEGPLFNKLAELAYTMQTKGPGTSATSERFRVVVPHREALQILTSSECGEALARDVIEAGSHLSLLEHKRAENEVQFIHQLLQEYFAGRALARKPEPARVSVPWRARDISEDLLTTCRELNINEPLPPLDGTGWEESVLFAVLMTGDRSRFIIDLVGHNLPLAARAIAQVLASEAHGAMQQKLDSRVVGQVQHLLLRRTTDPRADFRARIAAGRALGEIGDPRFEGPRNAKGRYEYLLPPVLLVPAGKRRVGSDEQAHKHEGPSAELALAAFHIAGFPVTNAEWDCFMRAGGYEDERWWVTPAAQLWRRGETTRAARDAQWRAFRAMLKENPDYLPRKLQTFEISEKAAEDHRQAMNTSDEEFEAKLKVEFDESLGRGEIGRYTEPRQWRNRAFNNPLQPVVSICWYEAQAYCEWLSAQTGLRWRLPHEVEWEAAARSGVAEGSAYPWGAAFDSARCNSFESHVRATTPVGIYMRPARRFDQLLTKVFGKKAASAFARRAELADISGNVFEWTASKYDKGRYPYPPKDINDGRNSVTDGDDPAAYDPRVLRGGSWYYAKDEARIGFRIRFHPGYRNQSTGFRLACDG